MARTWTAMTALLASQFSCCCPMGALSSFPAGANDHCTQNAYFESFSIQHPLDYSVVPSQFFLRLTGRVFDIPHVQANNNKFSACVYLDSALIECGLSFFDEIVVDVSKPGLQLLLVELRVDGHTMICQAKAEIFCCDDGEHDRAVAVKEQQDKVMSMLQFLIEVPMRGAVAQGHGEPHSPACPWCCRDNSHADGGWAGRVVVGIKSAAANVKQREAIRSSWLQRLPSDACAYFIIGNVSAPVDEADDPPPSSDGLLSCDDIHVDMPSTERVDSCAFHATHNDTYLQRVKHAVIESEKLLRGDVLDAGTINVEDSYEALVHKTSAFLKFAHRAHPSLDHVVLVDDDVYVRVEALMGSLLLGPEGDKPRPSGSPICLWGMDLGEFSDVLQYPGDGSSAVNSRSRFYAGEVFAERLHHLIKPQRNSLHKNYLNKSHYRLDVLPPFAAGNFMILSSDLVSFVANNIDQFLQPVGTLEDVTLAVWFQSLQVFPHHIPGVISLENAREVFRFDVAAVQAAINGGGSPTIDRFLHRCCNCSTGNGGDASTSLPLIAVYNLKSPDLFQQLSSHETVFEAARDKMVHDLNLEHVCDGRCLRESLSDASFLDELRRIAPFQG